MSRLSYLEIPVTPAAPAGPWRLMWRRPSGESSVGKSIFDDRAEAEMWAELANRRCREGCSYDVVPDGPR